MFRFYRCFFVNGSRDTTIPKGLPNPKSDQHGLNQVDPDQKSEVKLTHDCVRPYSCKKFKTVAYCTQSVRHHCLRGPFKLLIELPRKVKSQHRWKHVSDRQLSKRLLPKRKRVNHKSRQITNQTFILTTFNYQVCEVGDCSFACPSVEKKWKGDIVRVCP